MKGREGEKPVGMWVPRTGVRGPGRHAAGGVAWSASQRKGGLCWTAVGCSSLLSRSSPCGEYPTLRGAVGHDGQPVPQPHQRFLLLRHSSSLQALAFVMLFPLSGTPFPLGSQLSPTIPLLHNVLWEDDFWLLSDIWQTCSEWVEKWINVWHLCFSAVMQTSTHMPNILFTLLVKGLWSCPFLAPTPVWGLRKPRCLLP